MQFKRIPGFNGRVYVPETKGPKKHNCPDCCFCQICSDERCEMCLKRKSSQHKENKKPARIK